MLKERLFHLRNFKMRMEKFKRYCQGILAHRLFFRQESVLRGVVSKQCPLGEGALGLCDRSRGKKAHL